MATPAVSRSGETFSIEHVWGVDKDAAAIESYKYNIVARYGGVAICADANHFCERCIHDYRRITALAFGFPCNDFSLVGEKKGVNGQYGQLYKAGITAINKNNPYWFIAENVSGIHTLDQGKAFKTILQDLEHSGRQGYKLTAHLYKFEEYGVPQQRHRFIVVGIRKDKRLHFKVPAPTHGADRIPVVSASKALARIGPNVPNNEFPKMDPRTVLRLMLTPPWENAWFLDELLEMTPEQRRCVLRQLPWYEQELASYSDRELYRLIDYARLKCTKARMSHIYRRLHPDLPSYTITGSGGGGTHVYHWEEHRALTNREKARLQGFPDEFKFVGSKEEIRKQIGMAVPPSGARIIFEAILKTFANIDYDFVEPNYPIL
jgi:DNA (cytosine-5)-methyltransferase 1